MIQLPLTSSRPTCLQEWRKTLFVLALSGAASSLAFHAAAAPIAPRGLKIGKTAPPLAAWPRGVELALQRAGSNRAELEMALQRVPATQRAGLYFLLQNMPDADLRRLSARFLLRHLALSYGALAQAPWQKQIPAAVFLNDVLPYASLNETRDDSGFKLRALAAPLIRDCRTPGEAAHRLNQKLFDLVQVRYSTERKRPDQSALESMESGKATCSGLSILLVSACRAVGIPARVVGTPMWSNGRGNHTWVEIWDGDWQFLGAAEPDEQGLNHGWFAGDAAQAKRDVPQNAIYASSFRRGETHFPLVWAPELTWVGAVNVTDRYAAAPKLVAADKTRVSFRVLDASGKRVAAKITVTDANGAVISNGTSRDESADLNNFFDADLPRGGRFTVAIERGEQKITREFDAGTEAAQILTLSLEGAPPLWSLQPAYVAPPVAQPLAAPIAANLQQNLRAYFAASPQQQKGWKFSPELNQLLRENEPAVRQAAWNAYRAAPIHSAMKSDFDAKQVTSGPYLSPYLVKTVGTRPKAGWGLVIAMHGGGGAPKSLNDSQWQGMFKHYRDHPELGGYHYLSLRAPNDTWNGFYDDYVYPLIGNLIEQWTLFGEVDPGKVFIMGYSHGGYGAYAIGPKMPDRFAAIHASGAAATDGETTAKTLRNTVFSAMVGERDLAYDRLERNRKFDLELKTLRGARSDIFPSRVDVMAGFEHSNLRDHDKLIEMLPAVRNPVPRELTWLMTDSVITDFYWLQTLAPAKTREIDATCRQNRVSVSTTNLAAATVFLDSRLIDFAQPVEFDFNGQKSVRTLTPSLQTLCETLQRRGDPELAFSAQVDLTAAPAR